ncbi:MAG: hypothetical protein CBC38_06885 [Gammaproteobacteria bacterium TMED78]|nr:MAG: hypothetical protein CBC38_06885 [Gammaproteobacteria bacterium TMED78]|tara:strand:+ start:23063 stop:23569 length:507 start_codon:yes stop_codon:yes gene_type:complete
MKTVTLIRHAKSDWSKSILKDHDRDLAERGERDIFKIANIILNKGISPDLIMTSSALRAKKTAEIFSAVISYKVDKIKIKEQLYLADHLTIINEIVTQDEKIKNIILFGHNPGFTDAVNFFHNKNNQLDNLPTSGAVAFEFNCSSWSYIKKAKADFIYFEYPKKFQRT